MAYRNETDKTPACLIKLYDYIERNTGLCGSENPGDAHLNAGGTTMMITSDRNSFDSQGILLDYIESSDKLKINHVSVKKSFDGARPYLEVTEV